MTPKTHGAALMAKFLTDCLSVRSFVNGNMLARPLPCFRKIEDPARRDPDEGYRHHRSTVGKPDSPSRYLSRVGTVSSGPDAPDLRSLRITFGVPEVENAYVICLSKVLSQDQGCPASCVARLREKIDRSLSTCVDFGPYAVVVHDPGEFGSRLVRAAEKRGYSVCSGMVRYYDGDKPVELNQMEPLAAAFYKPARFSLENEFRIVLSGVADGGEELKLRIGDLSDIARVIHTKDLASLPDRRPRR